MTRLSTRLIYEHIDPKHLTPLPILHILDVVNSTNQYLKELPPTPTLTMCCAETQTNGRGRFGRTWHSPPYDNIYFSARYKHNAPLTALSGLGLVTSLSIVSTLHALGIKQAIGIKWPNDVLYMEKKLSGCLIEVVGKQPSDIIIGIGINVNQETPKQLIETKPRCSLFDITQKSYDRNAVIGMLINHLLDNIAKFMHLGLACFMQQWKQVDLLCGKQIVVTEPHGTCQGVANGIDHQGQLLLIDALGEIRAFSSCETSLAFSANLQLQNKQGTV